MNTIPSHWQIKTFEEICEDIDKGGPEGDKEFEYIEISSINNERKVIEDVRRITPEEASSRAKQRLKSKDLLISKVRPALNGVAMVSEELDGSIGTTGFYVVRTNDLVPKFLYYFVQTNKFIQDMDSVATGSSYPSIKIKDIEQYEVPVPPVSEQELIVQKLEQQLSLLDTSIRELKNILQKTQLYLDSVYKSGVFGDYHSDSATNQLEVDTIDEIDSIDPKIRAIIEKFDPLPDSWVWSIVGEVTQSLRNGIYKTKDHYNNDGVPCLRMYNIKNGQIKWYDIKHLDLTDDEFKKYQLRYGDVLVNRVNSRELVGKAAAIPPELDECVYESKNIRLRLNTQLVAPEYVAYWMKIFRREYYEVGMKQTTGQATITQSQLRWMPIPLPPRSVQSDIVSRTEQIRERVSGLNETVSKEIKRAENLRSSVLNSAYQGNMIDINDESRPSKKVTGSNNPETEQITLEDVN